MEFRENREGALGFWADCPMSVHMLAREKVCEWWKEIERNNLVDALLYGKTTAMALKTLEILAISTPELNNRNEWGIPRPF